MLCELQSLFFYGLKKPFYSAVSFTLTALFRACFFAVFFAAVALRSTVSVDRYGQLRIRCPSRSAQGHRPYKSYILLKNVITGVFLCLRKVVYSAASFFDRAFSGVFFLRCYSEFLAMLMQLSRTLNAESRLMTKRPAIR